jgi:Na+:H+ antiporter, NhaA family
VKPSVLFKEFFNSEKSSGVILIVCTIISLCLTNFIIGNSYADSWHQKAGFDIGPVHLNLSIEHWINDGLMAVFFLVVGLEIERELYIGELSSIRNAALPVIAAIGGMLIPAAIHFAFNAGTATQSGFGIPMATDIAFALGVLSLVGKRVPVSLKIFLTALAIIDDLGAIIIIALFYTEELNITYLLIALGIFILLLVLGRFRFYRLGWYLFGGIIMWYCMLQSGVHATISGVLLAFAIPFGDGREKSISYRLQHALHKPVAFIILPLFALANTAIAFPGNIKDTLNSNNSMGIMAGLVLGKPIGILLFCYAAIKLRIAKLAEGVSWAQLAGAGILAGIGFTMSIFITLLAFHDQEIIKHSKIVILFSSLIAGVAGYLFLAAGAASLQQTEDPSTSGER